MEVNGLACCAINEINGLSAYCEDDMETALVDALEENSWMSETGPQLDSAHLLFSEAKYPKYAELKSYGGYFKDAILKHKLGTVVSSKQVKNPNSGNYTTIYVWTLDKKACLAFLKKHS